MDEALVDEGPEAELAEQRRRWVERVEEVKVRY